MVGQLNPIPLTVMNPSLHFVAGFPVCCGIPLPDGVCRRTDELIVSIDGLSIDCQLTPLSLWPGGSLRWVLVECFVDVDAASELELLVQLRPRNTSSPAPDTDRSGTRRYPEISIVVDDDRTKRAIPKLLQDGRVLAPFAQMDVELTGSDERILEFRQAGETIAEPGILRSTFRTTGSFVDNSGEHLLDLVVRIDAYHALPQYKIQFTIHNKNAAHHPGGFWDLGDAGSFLFKELAIVVRDCKDSTLHWRSAGHNWCEGGKSIFSISQLTSGSKTVDSPNHVNALNKLPEAEKGFIVELDHEIVERGPRISPCVRMDSSDTSWAFCLEGFWENFPKSIRRDGDLLKIGLFPGEYPDTFELQGGEKKTHTLDIGPSGECLDWIGCGATVSVSPESRRAANVIPYDELVPVDESMDSLIEQGINGPNNFFIKRELIDEYGWRNFGDVYADHETWLRDSNELFSSHYNNQYDLVYGFLRMYMSSAKPEWFRLAKDLAEHVLDIDLYHTQADRMEYNGGLFWHTDHYRQAHTSSHRSYSKLQAQDASQPADGGGGGPGGEHCYTTGLKLYYLTTGSERARSAVLELARWVGHFYDGSGTLLEEIQRLLRWQLRAVYQVVRGADISRHRYPVHRGIGNLVVAQLDAFEITCEQMYLERAERVILGAIGPKDDLVTRGLEKVEENWFYSIFLQALIRFLDVKRSMNEYDVAFFYVRDSLMHYADWIVSREQPYLNNPDDLEYPNHTWVAQDIRRCAILLDSYRYADTERPDYLERSRFFARYVTRELESEPTSSYSRILAILMQNHGASALALAGPKRHALPAALPYSAVLHVPHTVGSLLSEEARRIGSALRRFSFRAEWKWLRVRF